MWPQRLVPLLCALVAVALLQGALIRTAWELQALRGEASALLLELVARAARQQDGAHQGAEAGQRRLGADVGGAAPRGLSAQAALSPASGQHAGLGVGRGLVQHHGWQVSGASGGGRSGAPDTDLHGGSGGSLWRERLASGLPLLPGPEGELLRHPRLLLGTVCRGGATGEQPQGSQPGGGSGVSPPHDPEVVQRAVRRLCALAAAAPGVASARPSKLLLHVGNADANPLPSSGGMPDRGPQWHTGWPHAAAVAAGVAQAEGLTPAGGSSSSTPPAPLTSPCPSAAAAPRIFVGVFTSFNPGGLPAPETRHDYALRRAAIRETWLAPSARAGPAGAAQQGAAGGSGGPAQGCAARPWEDLGVLVRFVLGRLPDHPPGSAAAAAAAAAESAVASEARAHGDIMLLGDVQECYSCLPRKTRRFFAAVLEAHPGVAWVVKADDDVYMLPHRLPAAAVQWGRIGAGYVGCMKHGVVWREPGSRWFEPQHLLLGPTYYLHAYGTAYALSTEVVSSVIMRNYHSLRMLANEDTTVGAWMLAHAVQHFEDMRMCAPPPGCSPGALAVLRVECAGLCDPATDMRMLHANSTCSQQDGRLKLVQATRAARKGVRTVIVVENATVAAALNDAPASAKHLEFYVPWADATDREGRPVVGHPQVRGGPRWAISPLHAHTAVMVAAARAAGRSAASAVALLPGARHSGQATDMSDASRWKADILGGNVNPEKAAKPRAKGEALPYRWLLLGRDDTLWLPRHAARLLGAYNDLYAAAVTDALYDYNGRELLLPSPLAAVCLPCHFDLPALTGRKHPPGLPQAACPICRPPMGCEFRFDACGGMTGGGMRPARGPGGGEESVWRQGEGQSVLRALEGGMSGYSAALNGSRSDGLPCGSKYFLGSGERCVHSMVVPGAGLALSATLLSYLDKERWVDCVRDVQPSSGEHSLSRCLWRNGFAYTHPAAGLAAGRSSRVFSEAHALFGSALARRGLMAGADKDKELVAARAAALKPQGGKGGGSGGVEGPAMRGGLPAAVAQAEVQGSEPLGDMPAAAAVVPSVTSLEVSAAALAECEAGKGVADCEEWAQRHAVSVHLGVPELDGEEGERAVEHAAGLMAKAAERAAAVQSKKQRRRRRGRALAGRVR